MSTQHIIHPFDPIYDAESKVLILGSFPSVISRQQQFYYANANNRFWPVMEILFQETITDRTAFCHKHHIALWDVIHSCTISGSKDSSIKDVEVNEIQRIVDETNIKAVFTTGRKASELYEKYVVCDTEHIALPSTSSANARMRLENLTAAYTIVREFVDEKD